MAALLSLAQLDSHEDGQRRDLEKLTATWQVRCVSDDFRGRATVHVSLAEVPMGVPDSGRGAQTQE